MIIITVNQIKPIFFKTKSKKIKNPNNPKSLINLRRGKLWHPNNNKKGTKINNWKLLLNLNNSTDLNFSKDQ